VRTCFVCALVLSQFLNSASAETSPDTQVVGREIVLNYGGPGSDGANSIVPTADGGYILGGWTTQSRTSSPTQSWVIRVDDRGRAMWDLPLPAAPYGITALSTSLDGGAFLIDGDPETRTGRTRVTKISFEGSAEKLAVLGSAADDQFNAIRPTFDGGVILAGQTNRNTQRGQDAWILKLDDSLSVEWFRVLGGAFDDSFEDVVLNSDGGYTAAGWRTESNDTVTGWVVQFDSFGSVKSEGSPGFGPATEIHALSPLPNNALVFAATAARETDRNRSLIIGRWDFKGGIQWWQRIDSDESALATDLTHADDGSFLVSARLSDGDLTTGLVVNFTGEGRVLAAQRHEGPTDQFALPVASRRGGGYALAGSSFTAQTLDQDVWLVIRTTAPDDQN